MVCPFGAIHLSTVAVNGKTKRAAAKCDLCVDRPEGPACVQACPTQAIRLTIPHEVVETARQASARRFLEALESQKQQQLKP
jgi:Fe-S-cluster-containing hydrogenase component 2